MENILLNKFRKIQNNPMTSFWKKYEKPHFHQILALFPLFSENQTFPEKSGSVTFFLLWFYNFMSNFRKIPWPVFEKNPEQTHGRTHGRTDGHGWIYRTNLRSRWVQKLLKVEVISLDFVMSITRRFKDTKLNHWIYYTRNSDKLLARMIY